MDSIWLSGKCVVLIACTDAHVSGCHLARTENSRDWGFLMARIAAPDVLVCDGGGRIERARRFMWLETRVQRCVLHVFGRVRRCATARPKTQAGVNLYVLAKDLIHASTSPMAAKLLVCFQRWCEIYEGFLRERGEDGRRFKHERLRRARKLLVALCNVGTLSPAWATIWSRRGALATSNRIENLNGRIRRVLANCCGMSIDHEIKAVFWFCFMHSEGEKVSQRCCASFRTTRRFGNGGCGLPKKEETTRGYPPDGEKAWFGQSSIARLRIAKQPVKQTHYFAYMPK